MENAIKTVEGLLLEDGEGYVLKTQAKNPLPQGYRPELDVTSELDSDLASRYMQLIGILRWAVELVGSIFFTRFRFCRNIKRYREKDT